MNLVDDIDIGIVVLNRLDQDLQRIGIQAASLLRMMELTGTLLSGSFLHPIMQWNTLIPNDLNMFVSLDTYNVVFSYLKKKGFTNCKKVYPSGQGHPGYGDNLQDISIIFEVRNRHTYKINVIVSKGQPILPILQFHSTIVMNYITYHGLVCLYNITLHRFGVANYLTKIPNCVKVCFSKYRTRGFNIGTHLEEEHTCKIDASCPQTIQTLFNDNIVHVRFPDFVEVLGTELRSREAKLAVWRLASGTACNEETNDKTGFIICDSVYTGEHSQYRNKLSSALTKEQQF
jgi:hypothetical protein